MGRNVTAATNIQTTVEPIVFYAVRSVSRERWRAVIPGFLALRVALSVSL
jgi:hypothetical protein